MHVSLAVAIWTELWCGFHRPVVNRGWDLPSSDVSDTSYKQTHDGIEMLETTVSKKQQSRDESACVNLNTPTSSCYKKIVRKQLNNLPAWQSHHLPVSYFKYFSSSIIFWHYVLNLYASTTGGGGIVFRSSVWPSVCYPSSNKYFTRCDIST